MWDKYWSKTGGRFKEWIRSIRLAAVNHGYLYAICREPGHFYDNIVHVISWIPVLWDDRDYDYLFLYIVIKHKLERMRRHHEKDKIIADWKEVADQIGIAIDCLDRLIKDEYVDDDYAKHVKKYGSFMDRGEMVPGPNGASVMYKHVSKPGEVADMRRIGKVEHLLIKSDLETFGKVFAEHSREWWS